MAAIFVRLRGGTKIFRSLLRAGDHLRRQTGGFSVTRSTTKRLYPCNLQEPSPQGTPHPASHVLGRAS